VSGEGLRLVEKPGSDRPGYKMFLTYSLISQYIAVDVGSSLVF
jgi:hypothetical protein